jgi:hypothetical protein
MRAREWAVAASFGEPSKYGIPELPSWRSCWLECGSLAFAAGDEEPFIAAERPIDVRR